MRRWLYIFSRPVKGMALSFTLAACTHVPPETKTITVKEAVPITCVSKIPAEPDLPDTDAKLAALDARADLVGIAKAYRVGRALRDAFIAEQAAALQGCGE